MALQPLALPLCILIAALIALTGAASPCCTPETWIGQEWFAGEEGGMIVGCRGECLVDAIDLLRANAL